MGDVMKAMIHRGSVLLLAGVVLLVGTGCAGVVNPHVTWQSTAGQGGAPVTLDQAVEYADQAKAAYREAIGNQSKLVSWLGIGLIPLMAAAAGIGITGGPAVAMTATSLAGAAGYGTGVWLYSKPNQRAWVAGYNATSCAVSAVMPLRAVSVRRPDIQEHINDLDTKRAEVVRRAAALNSARAAAAEFNAFEPVVRAAALVNDADELLKTAATTRTSARKMLGQADAAGGYLKEAVDRIYGQVSGLLVENGQDVQALAAIVGGLVQNYRGFAAVVDAAKPATPVTAQGADRSSLIRDVVTTAADLDNAMRELAAANRTLADDVEEVAGTTPIETLRACGVTAEQVAAPPSPLVVDPPGTITFEAGVGATEGRVVRGGAPPFDVQLHGALTEMTLQKTEPHGPAFSIRTTDKTPAGKATVFVTERSGNKLFIPVVVSPKSSSGGAAPGAPGSGTQATAETAALRRVTDAFNASRPDIPLAGGLALVVDKAVLSESANKITVDVSIKKGAAPATTPEATGVTDDAIKQALLTIKEARDNGIKSSQLEIGARKPPRL